MKKSMILNVLCASMIVTPSAHGMLREIWNNDSRNIVLAWLAGSAVVGGVTRYVTKQGSLSDKDSCATSMLTGMLAGSGIVYRNDGAPFAPVVLAGGFAASVLGVVAADRIRARFGARSANQFGGSCQSARGPECHNSRLITAKGGVLGSFKLKN